MQSFVRPIARRSFFATGGIGAVPIACVTSLTSKPRASILCRPVSRMRETIWTPPAALAVGATMNVSADGARPARSPTQRATSSVGSVRAFQHEHAAIGLLRVRRACRTARARRERSRAADRSPLRSSRRRGSPSRRTAMPCTRSPGDRSRPARPGMHRRRSETGTNDMYPSPPIHAATMSCPAARPPAAFTPASMTRAPLSSVCTSTPNIVGSLAIRSAMEAARTFSVWSNTWPLYRDDCDSSLRSE